MAIELPSLLKNPVLVAVPIVVTQPLTVQLVVANAVA
jgi:hypothetical protein